jgi:hypothetical protein
VIVFVLLGLVGAGKSTSRAYNNAVDYWNRKR